MLTPKQIIQVRARIKRGATIAAIMVELKVPQVEVERQRAELRKLGDVPDSRKKDTRAKVLAALAKGLLPAVISKKYGVCRETVYRYRREAKESVTISRNMLTRAW